MLPREAVAAPPLQGFRTGWTGLWATWSGVKCPCPWQWGWNEMICKVPSKLNHSVILWFYAVSSLRRKRTQYRLQKRDARESANLIKYLLSRGQEPRRVKILQELKKKGTWYCWWRAWVIRLSHISCKEDWKSPKEVITLPDQGWTAACSRLKFLEKRCFEEIFLSACEKGPFLHPSEFSSRQL